MIQEYVVYCIGLYIAGLLIYKLVRSFLGKEKSKAGMCKSCTISKNDPYKNDPYKYVNKNFGTHNLK